MFPCKKMITKNIFSSALKPHREKRIPVFKPNGDTTKRKMEERLSMSESARYILWLPSKNKRKKLHNKILRYPTVPLSLLIIYIKWTRQGISSRD